MEKIRFELAGEALAQNGIIGADDVLQISKGSPLASLEGVRACS